MSTGMKLLSNSRKRGLRSYRWASSIVAALCSVFVSSMCSLSAHAVTQFVPIVPNGSAYELHVAPHGGDAHPIVAYFPSSGSSSVTIEVGVEGPAGLRGAAFGARSDAEQLDAMSPLVPWQRQNRMKLRAEVGLKAKEYDGFVIASEISVGTIRFHYHAQKDACVQKPSGAYITGVWLDLSGVSSELRATGFTIRLAMREHQFQGARVASIKPVSDGKYRGEPILLMGSVSYGDEYVNIVRRSRGVVRSTRRIPVVKYVSYKGYPLSLARLRGVLRGGRATFELTNGGLIYGVCFELRRRRQVANGYPLSRS